MPVIMVDDGPGTDTLVATFVRGLRQWQCVEQSLVETPMFYQQFEPQGGDHSSAQGIALGKRIFESEP